MDGRVKIAAWFAVGALIGAVVGSQFVPTKPQYYADGDHGYLHKRADCKVGAVITFASIEEAERANLLKCPECFPENHRVAKK